MANITLYEDLRNEKFKLDNRKKTLIKERDNITYMIDEVQRIIEDLEFILCQHGKQVYADYIEDKEPETGDSE